jgi:uncharacterized coiled-coil protein SlyX
MRKKTIGFGYVKNLGNYENCKLYMEAELEDWENPLESLELLRTQVADELNLPDHYRELRRKYSWQLQTLEDTNAALAATEDKLKKAQQKWEEFTQSLITRGLNPELVTTDPITAVQEGIKHQIDLATESLLPTLSKDPAENENYYWADTVKRDIAPTLPDFDSPNLAAEIECIVIRDKQILEEFWPLLEKLTWSEKMAVGQTAYFFIAITAQDSLLKLIPVRGDGSFSKPLQEAMELLEELSLEMLGEVAAKILKEDIELNDGEGSLLPEF